MKNIENVVLGCSEETQACSARYFLPKNCHWCPLTHISQEKDYFSRLEVSRRNFHSKILKETLTFNCTLCCKFVGILDLFLVLGYSWALCQKRSETWIETTNHSRVHLLHAQANLCRIEPFKFECKRKICSIPLCKTEFFI